MNRERPILMNEASVYFEDARAYTVDDVGALHPRVCFHADHRHTSTGITLLPCLIWKRKNRGLIERLGSCYIAYKPRAWVDQDLLLNCLKQTPAEVVVKSVQACGFNDDSSAWHIAKDDGYGSKFRAAWQLRESGDRDSDQEGDMTAVMETFDEILIEDLAYTVTKEGLKANTRNNQRTYHFTVRTINGT
ncbi:unnamed protein product [Phytophthora lilii]|uniref:Unnamed protein product n=1 Tax=Phytophthora lilii TaxID=2077276 RepID=A0A9W7CQR3_9STRA|nr:unnamed protein product [Phytophthora lilii]